METKTDIQAGERTHRSLSDEVIVEQLVIAERALLYAGAAAERDSTLQREIHDSHFRVQQTLKAARLIAERKHAERNAPIIQRLPGGEAIEGDKTSQERIEKGSMVRLVEGDRRWVRVKGVHPSGTAVVLCEARGGYFHWNIGDVELEPREERHGSFG